MWTHCIDVLATHGVDMTRETCRKADLKGLDVAFWFKVLALPIQSPGFHPQPWKRKKRRKTKKEGGRESEREADLIVLNGSPGVTRPTEPSVRWMDEVWHPEQ